MTFQPGQFVIRQGERGQHAAVVLTGCVKIVVNTEFGRDVLVALSGSGELFGELAALDGASRSANVIACRPTTARVVPGRELGEFLHRNSHVALAVARTVAERLRRSDLRCVDLIACPAPTRVGRVLADVAATHGQRGEYGWELGVPLNQNEIASLAGVALSTVEKTLHELQSAEVLSRHYRRIVITDLAALRRFGGIGGPTPY